MTQKSLCHLITVCLNVVHQSTLILNCTVLPILIRHKISMSLIVKAERMGDQVLRIGNHQVLNPDLLQCRFDKFFRGCQVTQLTLLFLKKTTAVRRFFSGDLTTFSWLSSVIADHFLLERDQIHKK